MRILIKKDILYLAIGMYSSVDKFTQYFKDLKNEYPYDDLSINIETFLTEEYKTPIPYVTIRYTREETKEEESDRLKLEILSKKSTVLLKKYKKELKKLKNEYK